MKKAVIYARYSSENQSEQSIEGQVRVCDEYAQRNDILIVGSYIDRAMTGTNDHRPEFQRMIRDSSKKEWEYVIVYKLDRFSRDKYETVIHRKALRDNGVRLLSAMENIPDTPEGIILEGLLESMNQYFSAELSQKTKRGMRENRLKGFSQGGKLVYGYKVENKKILINEDEAAVVRYIFERYDAGDYVRDIVATLKERGITKRGKPFAKSTVYRMLVMEYYTGIYRFKDEVYKNMYPQIISKELFDRVKAKAASLKKGTTSTMKNYLLSRKLICGYCGRSVNGTSGTCRNGGRNYYYRCSGKQNEKLDCPKTTLSKDAFENFIIKKVVGELSKPDVMDKLLNRLIDIQSNRTKVNEQIQVLEKEQRQAKLSLKNLIDAVERGINNPEMQERMNERREQIASLEKAIYAEKCKIGTTVKKEQLQKYYNDALKKNGKEIVGLLIKIIRVYNDKIEITFNSPIKKSPDDNQGSFYATNLEYQTICNNIVTRQTIKTQYLV